MVGDNTERKESEEKIGHEELDNVSESDPQVLKKWLIETRTKLKISSTIEYSDYNEALDLFNKKSTEGKNIILYEVQKSSDGKILKKVPILNYSKHLERKRMAEEEAAAAAISTAIAEGKAEGSIKKPKPGLKAIKYRIFLLIGIVAGFIVTLFLMDMLAGGGGNAGRSGHHIIVFETLYVHLTLAIDSLPTIVQKL